ncbi:MAG: response regulator [Leptospiraceae bacterium]|nr:response regulator [Leptospiraceae bacterium]
MNSTLRRLSYTRLRFNRRGSISDEGSCRKKNALELVAKFDFDAVLTDIMMPEMDGYELIRQLRNRGMTKTPILAVTAKAMQGDEELCIKAGATGYLTKPVDIQSLMDWLKDI